MNRIIQAALAAAATLALAPAARAQRSDTTLSPIERQIVAYVRAHSADQVALLEKAVNISSGTLNLAGVRAVGALFQPEFTSLGFDAKWVPLPDSVGRAGHLFAEHAGEWQAAAHHRPPRYGVRGRGSTLRPLRHARRWRG